jgi:hypothetical protein
MQIQYLQEENHILPTDLSYAALPHALYVSIFLSQLKSITSNAQITYKPRLKIFKIFLENTRLH